jgi:HD-GYP domain-containing protein (c-di-GMP phosphodiesterase class II)
MSQGSPNRPLVDRLAAALRVADPPERFQAEAARAVRAELGVAAAAWVPLAAGERVVADGAVEGLAPEGWRQLLPGGMDRTAATGEGPPGTGAPGGVGRVAVAAAEATGGVVGWMAAVRRDGGPFGPAELGDLRGVATLVATQRHNARRHEDLKGLFLGIVRAMVCAIDAKDPYTAGHSERVARIAVRLGQELGLGPAQRGDLYLMGLLHDVGKIGVEDRVLKKAGGLDDDEYRAVREHVRIGVHILSDLGRLGHLLPGVAHHHERMDGHGYPAGLSGEAIPLAARILAVADAFDAMSSGRPYRRGLSAAEIDAILRDGAGTQWDDRVVAALFACRADVETIRAGGLGDSLPLALQRTLGRGGPPTGG